MISVVLGLVASQICAPDAGLNTYQRSGSSNSPHQCLFWHENTEIVHHQHIAGEPTTPNETEFAAINLAFATWQSQLATCSNLRLIEGNRTTSRQVGYVENSNSNENIVLFRLRTCANIVAPTDPCWVDDNCGNVHDCWQYRREAIAMTTTSYDKVTGTISDADVEFNSPNYVFTTVNFPICVRPNFHVGCVATDIQNTMTHEIGHMLGLDHHASPTSTMFASADPGDLAKRALDCGTKRFVCETYPRGQTSRGCMVLAAPDKLGKPAGCTAVPGSLLASIALLGLGRRRR